jgi:signal transduction histidine kinase
VELLRSLWGEPRPSDAPRRVWRDWALVGVVLSLAVLEGFLRPDLPHRVVAVGVVIATAPTLLWRRARPLPVLVVVFAVTGLAPVLASGNPVEAYSMAYVLVLVYALARWGSGREVVIGTAAVVVQVCFTVLVGRTGLGDGVGGLVVTSAAAALGAAIRYRAVVRTRTLDQVKLVERERLARDLHDTVAHHVSAIAIRAQAGLAMAPSNPEAAVDALKLIESEASSALVEMRGMVRVLRRDLPADLVPSPRVADLEQLAGHGRSGPAVDVGIVGDVDDLLPSVGTAIYRLAQESVTNARRHARHATRIEVRVTADDTSVRLRVSDDGDAGAARPAVGYGLIGMVERAGLLGGTCEAGPNPGRGWTVTAVLPRTGASA